MKVGDYVRNGDGISKIERIELDDDNVMWYSTDIGFYTKDEITKSSPNLIDLIEVGDYVNGWLINEIISNYDNGKKESNTIVGYKVGMWGTVHETFWDDEEIKEILTKEQYEREVFGV